MPTIPSGAADRHGHYTDIPCATASPRTPHTCNRHATLQISFSACPTLPEDLVPYWDMKAPGIPDIPRDASAAAIMASALYELRTYVSAEDGNRYQSIADKIVDSLNRHYQAEPGTTYGFLLLHSTGHHPGGDEIDVPINYADYYYLEALARKEALKQ